jgi:hypothetical protein
MSNTALESAGVDERVTHLSHLDRGLEQVPGRHHGPTATAIERKENARAAKEGRAPKPASDRIRELAMWRAQEQTNLDAQRRLKAEIMALEAELPEALEEEEQAEAMPWLNERLQFLLDDEHEELERLAEAKAHRLAAEERQRQQKAEWVRRQAEQARRERDELRRQEIAQTQARIEQRRKAVAAREMAGEEARPVAEQAAVVAAELARGTRGVRSDGLMVRPPLIWDGALRWSLRNGERSYSLVGERVLTERADRILLHQVSDAEIDALLTLSAAKWPTGFEITGDDDFVARVTERAALRSAEDAVTLSDPAQRAAYEAARMRLWGDDDDDTADPTFLTSPPKG